MRELGMDEAAMPARELAVLARRRDLRGEVRRLLASGSGDGIAALDTERMRMTFPCRLEIRLRSGRVVEVEGREPGSCGSPVEDQRAVVDARCRAAGLQVSAPA
jgi:hypothetical protein